MKKRVFLWAAIYGGWGLLSVNADEITRQLQEELRRRYQYFGEIDGRPSKELESALKSFQKRKGLVLSGVADVATRSSLGIEPAPERMAGNPPLPDVPILRSDAAREISETDREFLRNLEESASRAPAPVPVKPEAEASRPDPVPGAESVVEGTAVEEFIRNYLRAAAAETPEEELRAYADRLDYFDHGTVDRKFVARDVERYYRRWAERKFTLLRIRVTGQTPKQATVEFRIRFELKGKGESAAGQTDNIFKVRRTETGFELIQLKEKRVRL